MAAADADVPAGDVRYWLGVCEGYGWAACPLRFGVHDDLVTDNPATAALHAAATRSISVGIPHPQYGVMRATMLVTPAATLTRLASIAHAASAHAFVTSRGMPHLYVGRTHLTDRVGGRERVVLGVLVWLGPLGAVCVAPMTLVRWHAMWLPYFEDDNEWVSTGWDADGRAAEIHKPFGWGCPALGAEAGEAAASTRASLAARHNRMADTARAGTTGTTDTSSTSGTIGTGTASSPGF